MHLLLNNFFCRSTSYSYFDTFFFRYFAHPWCYATTHQTPKQRNRPFFCTLHSIIINFISGLRRRRQRETRKANTLKRKKKKRNQARKKTRGTHTFAQRRKATAFPGCTPPPPRCFDTDRGATRYDMPSPPPFPPPGTTPTTRLPTSDSGRRGCPTDFSKSLQRYQRNRAVAERGARCGKIAPAATELRDAHTHTRIAHR